MALAIPDALRDMDDSEIADISEDENMAHDAIRLMRWPPHGKPVCPHCACDASYYLASRKRWKCKGCDHQFTVTSGTWMAGTKLRHSTLLIIIWSFAKGEVGTRAVDLQRMLGCEYKTAMVWLGKLRSSAVVSAPVSRDWKGYWQRGRVH